MPFEHPWREAPRLAEWQDALKLSGPRRAIEELSCRVLLLVFRIVVCRAVGAETIEEGCRGKLLLVADHHDLVCSGNRPERIFRPDLACLVDHEQVERHDAGRKKLSDRYRAHQQDGLDPLDGFA